MKIVNISEVKAEASSSKLFSGSVYIQHLIDEEVSKGLRAIMVSFSPGARNVFHTHTFDHVLYVTEGKGIVATDQEEIVVTPGTVIFIPAGERHWHGATKDSAFSHLVVVTPGETSF